MQLGKLHTQRRRSAARGRVVAVGDHASAGAPILLRAAGEGVTCPVPIPFHPSYTEGTALTLADE